MNKMRQVQCMNTRGPEKSDSAREDETALKRSTGACPPRGSGRGLTQGEQAAAAVKATPAPPSLVAAAADGGAPALRLTAE